MFNRNRLLGNKLRLAVLVSGSLIVCLLLVPQVWSASQGQLVFSFNSSNSWENYLLWRPCVIYDIHTLNFMMYYSGENANGHVDNIGLATSSDGITWSRNPSNPVLRTGAGGEWDSDSVNEAWVIHEGNQYKMWYSGQQYYANGSIRAVSIGYAVSPDGVSWMKFAGNPVFIAGPSGTWDDREVWRPIVVHSGSIYRMYYRAISWSGSNGFGIATSDDGIHWTRSGQLSVPRSSWDSYGNGVGGIVVLDSGVFVMVYTGAASKNGPTQIGMASSNDGIMWTPIQDNPIVTYGSGNWDAGGVTFPMVLTLGRFTGQYFVYYTAYGVDLLYYSVGLAILSMSDYPLATSSTTTTNYSQPSSSTTSANTLPTSSPGLQLPLVAYLLLLIVIGAVLIAAIWVTKQPKKTKQLTLVSRSSIKKGAVSKEDKAGKAFCVNCGKELPVDWKFCRHCGAKQP